MRFDSARRETTVVVATDNPRIYVASLSDYNAGRLHGAWIDLDETTTVDEVEEAVQAMLATSPEPVAEEWAIHDYEGFGGIRIEEYAGFAFVVEVAAGMAEHGDAYAAWVMDDSSNTDPGRFRDCFVGEYEDAGAYAYEKAQEQYGRELDDIPFINYVDWDQCGDEWLSDYNTADAPGGGIYVFDSNA